MGVFSSIKSWLEGGIKELSKPPMEASYSSYRARIEALLDRYQNRYRFSVHKSKLSDNVWSIEVDGFMQAYNMFTRIVGPQRFVSTKVAGNYRYTLQIDEHTTLILTDKVRRGTRQVANIYLSDKSDGSYKRLTIHFNRNKQRQ